MLETTRLLLRKFTMDDLDELAQLRADPSVWKYIGEQSRAKVEERLRYYISLYEPHGFGMWAVVHKAEARLIGWCGLVFLDETPEVEVGYGIARAYWGQGLVTEAAEAALDYGFHKIGLERIVAVALPENTASRRVMEKLGMKYQRNVMHYGFDCAYYSITRDEFQRRESSKSATEAQRHVDV
ncbi:MAG: GNAT family N-acetyltransferase [Acidobacteria bacterium]|nr:GNAT family N-acetyltransferase [Acidobacteriota bacterium]